MATYEADIYYSGFITVTVEAETEDEALDAGREEVARFHNNQAGNFNDQLEPSLERWGEADTVRKI